MAVAETAQLITEVRLDDKMSAGLNKVQGSLKKLDVAAAQVGRGIRQVGQGIDKALTRAAIGAGTAIGFAVKSAGDFEASLNTINTIVKLNSDQLTTLGEGIRTTFRNTGVPIEELTSAYYDLLSAGVKVSDAQSVLNTAVKLGVGGLATTKESVDLLTTAINAYGLNADQAAHASDIFATAVRDGKVVVSELAGSFADVAPLASQVGIKLEELGAAYGVLTARGVPAAEVGTQFNRSLIELLKPGKELKTILKGLGETTFEASLKSKGLVGTLADIRKEAEKEHIPFQTLFRRIEAYKFALATTGPNQAKFTAELKIMGKAAGETDAQFAEREKGLNYQLGRLKAAAQDAGITIGQALIPKLVPLIEKLNAFIQDHQADIASFGQKLADGFGAFADRMSTVDFSGVISGLKLLGEVGKRVVDLFLSLPPNIQGLLITGLAVNKLTGGALGTIAKGGANIAGGLLKLVFDRGSSPANPLWVQSVAGGVGGAGGGGLYNAGVGLGLIAKFVLGPAAAVIIGSEIAAAINDATIKPAANFEQQQFKAVVDSKDLNRIVSGLDAIETQQRTGNTAAQVALIASNIPFIGDALGHVGPKLEEQRQLLLQQLQQMGLTREQAIQMVAAQHALIARSGTAAVQLAAKIQGLHLPLGIGNAIARMILNSGAAHLNAIRTQAIIQSGKITALDRTLKAKNFSPTITVQSRISVQAKLSVTQALATITQQQSIRYGGKQVPI